MLFLLHPQNMQYAPLLTWQSLHTVLYMLLDITNTTEKAYSVHECKNWGQCQETIPLVHLHEFGVKRECYTVRLFYWSTMKIAHSLSVSSLLHIQLAELLTEVFTGKRDRKNKQLTCCNNVELLTCLHMTYSSTNNSWGTSQQTFLSHKPQSGAYDRLTSLTFLPTAVNHGLQCWSGLYVCLDS